MVELEEIAERKNRRDAEGAEFSRREKTAELNQRFDDAENDAEGGRVGWGWMEGKKTSESSQRRGVTPDGATHQYQTPIRLLTRYLPPSVPVRAQEPSVCSGGLKNHAHPHHTASNIPGRCAAHH